MDTNNKNLSFIKDTPLTKGSSFDSKIISLDAVRVEKQEIEIINETPLKIEKELICKTDTIDPYKRRVLIAINTYGLHNLSAAASYIGNLTTKELRNLIETDEEIQKALREGEIPCFTKAELISRLCVEADTAQKSQDRIKAIEALMEFRGLAAPEGGSRAFARSVMRFKKA